MPITEFNQKTWAKPYMGLEYTPPDLKTVQLVRQTDSGRITVPEKFPLLLFPLGNTPIPTQKESVQEKWAFSRNLQYFEKYVNTNHFTLKHILQEHKSVLLCGHTHNIPDRYLFTRLFSAFRIVFYHQQN